MPNLPTRNYDALLVPAGRVTTRIALGTAVMPTSPHHPIAMAQEAMTATRSRLVLGIGLSHRPTIEDVMGLSYAHPARHMQEYLTVLQALPHNHTVAYAGQTLRVTADVRSPNPGPCRSSWRPSPRGCCNSPAAWPRAPLAGWRA